MERYTSHSVQFLQVRKKRAKNADALQTVAEKYL